MTKRTLRHLVVMSTAVLMLVSSAGAAIATETARPRFSDPAANAVEQPEASLMTLPGGAGSRQVMGLSPAGCLGKSNNPHSTWVGQLWTVKGMTQVDCDWFVPTLGTSAQMWKHRWWGYQKVGVETEKENFGLRQVKSGANTGQACADNWYRTSGDHWSIEGGIVYWASTFNNEEVDDC